MDRNRSLLSVTINILFLLLFLFIPAICLQAQKEPVTVNQNATRKTRALFLNLRSLSGKGILVGHQDDLAYGVSWKDEPERSDIRDVTGAYPALFGWDIIAYDDYRNIRRAEDRQEYVRRLETLSRIAKERNKVAALSETGLEKVPVDDWYTGVLLKGLKENEATRNIAYVMLWRNANPCHHYAPFKGHSSEQDFIEFFNDPFTLFIDDLPEMYRQP